MPITSTIVVLAVTSRSSYLFPPENPSRLWTDKKNIKVRRATVNLGDGAFSFIEPILESRSFLRLS
jgi:hypothetical protein